MIYVIGSGPTGVSAASALLAQGLAVTLLDAGGRLETQIQENSDRLSRTLPEQWPPADVSSLRGALSYNAKGAPRKLHFGSDYANRDEGDFQPIEKHKVDVFRSFARGGLSVMWGASMLPYTDWDLADWPITAADLAPHYAAVLRLTGLSAARDELETRFPLFIEPTANIDLSRQAQSLLERLRQNAPELNRQQIHFGKARLAIMPSRGIAPGCVYCGLCMYGCPYELIYTAEATLRTLITEAKNFTYVPDFVVQSLREIGDSVEIHAQSIKTGETRVFASSRVYLAAGVHATTRILLESLQAHERPVLLRQSDCFLLPLLMARSAPGIAEDRLHTMSQLFIEIMDPAIGRHYSHLQLYTYSDFYPRMAKKKLGLLYPALAPLLTPVIERLAVLSGYLHSDESASIRAWLSRSSAPPAKSVLHLEAVDNPATRPAIRAVMRALARNRKRIGAVMLPLRVSKLLGLPGSGAHVGGSFPMRENPGEFESDILGRPTGFRRVHIVDSSVFPTVPSTTITLAAMANAHRIASHPNP